MTWVTVSKSGVAAGVHLSADEAKEWSLPPEWSILSYVLTTHTVFLWQNVKLGTNKLDP